ncbi:ribonuclease H-like domain-containing protein [Tanacetum coccineum]
MVTRAQVGTVKPNPRCEGHASHISLIPKSSFVALSYPNWRDVMHNEYNALIKNSTWILVPKPPDVNVVRSMWLFWHKYHVDGSLSRYKSRLVANVRSQQFGVDCDDTFSPVVKPDTINTGIYGFVQSNWTPVDIESKLGSHENPVSDRTLYRSLVALKRFLSYVRVTLDFRLQLYASSTGSLVAYFDVKWVGCPFTRRSTSGYCVLLGDNLQHTFSRSSVEAEYRGDANVVAETAWLRNLLRELHTPLLSPTPVYCDNVSTIYLTANPVQHQRTKHIEIDIHFVRDMVTRGQACSSCVISLRFDDLIRFLAEGIFGDASEDDEHQWHKLQFGLMVYLEFWM